jgi:hypothetical protein
MTTRRHWICVVAAAFSLVPLAAAADSILVQVPAVFDPQAPVSDAVRHECAVDMLLGNFVYDRIRARFPDSATIQKSTAIGNEKVLNVTILSVHAAGGGAWSGRKSMAVRADLLQSGKVIATTVKERRSGGGAFGGTMGTCAILERVTAALGTDIAGWLSQALLVGGVKAVSAPTAEPKQESASEQAPAPGKAD